MMARWDKLYLGLADHVASWSKDPSTKVGAVVVRPDRTVASLGFNGLPRGVRDWPERYADRETKLRKVVHAEMNALLHAREALAGYTLYCSPLPPCAQCTAALIQAGIKRVVAPPWVPERWQEDHAAALAMMVEAGVEWEWRHG